MKNLFKTMMGVKPARDIGIVDTTTVGKSKYITSLAIAQRNDDFLLEISLVSRGRISRNGTTFYWSIEPALFDSLRDDLKRIIVALENPNPVPLRGRGFSKMLWRFMGFRAVGDIGALSMTDGTSKSFGYVVEKEGIRFLVLVRSAPNRSSEDLLSLTALKAIEMKLENLINETANQ